MAPRLPESLLPLAAELTKMFSEATGSAEMIDDRDRLLLNVWETKVRPKVLKLAESPTAEPHRWRLPNEREGRTARFEFPAPEGGDEFVGYITTGVYADGSLGEIFLEIAKEGSFVSGILDAFVTSVSIGLQHGIPLTTFVKKFKYAGFGPSGVVIGAPDGLRGFYKSVLDYLFHYLEHRYPDGRLPAKKTMAPAEEKVAVKVEGKAEEKVAQQAEDHSAAAASPAGAASGTEASDDDASKPASDVVTSATES